MLRRRGIKRTSEDTWMNWVCIYNKEAKRFTDAELLEFYDMTSFEEGPGFVFGRDGVVHRGRYCTLITQDCGRDI